MGLQAEPVITEGPGDYRFQDDQWREHPAYALIKQLYLLNARTLYQGLTGGGGGGGGGGGDDQARAKVEFFTRQFIDALAPSNFLATNPEAQREFFRSGGLSVLRGLRNYLQDQADSGEQLRIKMTDFEAFELGENIAVTPGQVVYQTPLMQLIQYQPTTVKVRKRPLLIIPPWINKYYILDLRPKNSFIRWAVEQGHTVFVISWVNPDASYAETGFEIT